jgi:hypothetical protein
MGKSSSRTGSPVYMSASTGQLSPPSSVFEISEPDIIMDNSRPTSLAIPRTTSPITKAPSLSEILNNTAPPPWTLSALTAYLSQNHCLETLEFILDAERYRDAYEQRTQAAARGFYVQGPDTTCSLWHKVIAAYIMPCAPREVNLPASVRDRLVQLSCNACVAPHPSELDEAVRIVHELMNDSVLVPFLESLAPTLADSPREESATDSKPSRTRLGMSKETVKPVEEPNQSPKSSFRPLLGLGRSSGHRSTSTLTESADTEMVTDEASSGSTPGAEPMTPPTTPPTSDYTFSTSPTALQRAISGNSWKRVGAKLGIGKKNKAARRSKQNLATSTTITEVDPLPLPEEANRMQL